MAILRDDRVTTGRSSGGSSPVIPLRPRWQDKAACKGSEDPVFFPESESAVIAQEAYEQFCRMCPVRVECLAWALKRKERGIWAGTATFQRAALVRSKNRAKCPSCGCRKLVSRDSHDICAACGVSWPTPAKSVESHALDDAG